MTNSFTTNATKLTPELEKEFERMLDWDHTEVSIAPKNDGDNETPFAWDAWFSLEEPEGFEAKRSYGTILQITGGVGPSGFGSVTIRLPLAQANGYEITGWSDRELPEAVELAKDK